MTAAHLVSRLKASYFSCCLAAQVHTLSEVHFFTFDRLIATRCPHSISLHPAHALEYFVSYILFQSDIPADYPLEIVPASNVPVMIVPNPDRLNTRSIGSRGIVFTSFSTTSSAVSRSITSISSGIPCPVAADTSTIGACSRMCLPILL